MMKRTQTRRASQRLLCLIAAFALACTSFAAIGFAGRGARKVANAAYAPNEYANITTKGANLFTNRLSNMSGTEWPMPVQPRLSGGAENWYGTTIGWTPWVESTQFDSEQVTGLSDAALGSTTTAAKFTFSGGTANEAENNFVVYNSADNGDSPTKLGGKDPALAYFSLMVNVEQTTWFDITVEDKAGTSLFYDLGRRFKVEASDGWKEIGKDENGNYLPFRRPDTLITAGEGSLHSRNSSARSGETNAKENNGSAYFALPTGENYIKIYTYTTETGSTVANGLTGSASFQMTNAYIWNVAASFVISVGEIGAKSRVFLSTAAGSPYGSETIIPVISPEAAENKTLAWSTSDEGIATVADGVITAVRAGTCTVTAAATDGSDVTKEIAVTVYDDDAMLAMTPADLQPVTQIARNRLPGANFTANDFPILGRAYGQGWTFAYGESPTNATWENIEDVTIPTDGVNSAIRITSNGGTSAQNDGLTYSYLHGAVGNNEDVVNEVMEEGKIFYFSSMVKVEKPTWFSVTIGYSPTTALGTHYEGNPFYDLGRKFLVTPEMGWTEIGKADGEYLPFRSNGQNSNDASPSAGNSYACATGENYANEEKGNVLFNLPGAPATNDLTYGFIRILAYGADPVANEDGSGVPNGSGFVSGDSYDLTAVRFWSYDSIPAAAVIDVETVKLNKTTLDLTVGQKETLTAEVLPADASYPDVYWTSNNTAVATVNPFTGEVTAVAVGTADIKAEADGVSATCTVTVSSAPVAGADKSALQTKYDAVKDIEQGEYTQATWDVFTAARTAAKGVLDNANATQSEVDLALTALNAAHEGLTVANNNSGCKSAAAGMLACLLPLGFLIVKRKKQLS